MPTCSRPRIHPPGADLPFLESSPTAIRTAGAGLKRANNLRPLPDSTTQNHPNSPLDCVPQLKPKRTGYSYGRTQSWRRPITVAATITARHTHRTHPPRRTDPASQHTPTTVETQIPHPSSKNSALRLPTESVGHGASGMTAAVTWFSPLSSHRRVVYAGT